MMGLKDSDKGAATGMNAENDSGRWIFPAAVLLALWILFLWYLAHSAVELPERVATHFSLSGEANGWMSRAGAIAFMRAMGLGLPLFIVLVAGLLRLLPASMINIPNREYWLAPERRARTVSVMFRQMLWLACLLVGFLGGLHYLTVRANQTVPAHMPGKLLLAVTLCFLAGLGIWIVSLIRSFSTRAMSR